MLSILAILFILPPAIFNFNNVQNNETSAIFNSNIVQKIDSTNNLESILDSSAISIIQLYFDAKYGWDKLQLRKDILGPIQTDLYFGTEVEYNVNTTSISSYYPLISAYSMYKITNDTGYLDLAKEMFSNVLKYCKGQITVLDTVYDVFYGYDWKQDVLLEGLAKPTTLFLPIAIEDPYFISSYENLLSDSHELFWSPHNLIYPSRNMDGEIVGSDCHLTWYFGSSIVKKISQLLWLSELTENQTYKTWADETIEAIWAYHPPSSLLPRNLNPITGSIKDSTIAHYDMAGWLCVLELAYYLNNQNKSAGTGTHTYLDLINETAQGISDHMWNPSSQIWGYKSTYNTVSISNGIPEMNSIYVDYAMILAYEITKNEEFLNKSILDFQNVFMGSDPVIPNGLLMDNSLVIHSPNTLPTQSQFIGSSNIMVARTASLLYQYTQNANFLQKAKHHYNQLMSTHRFEKGYTDILKTDTLQPYSSYQGSHAKVFDEAPKMAILALPSSFIPAENVFINWGYGAPTTLPDGYGLPGAFTEISIDLEHNRVNLKSVTSDGEGSLLIYFADGSTIESVIFDGTTPYFSFTGNNLTCETGTHSYTITFTEPPETPVTATTPIPPSTTITTSTTSTTITTSTTSTTITTSTTSTTSTTNPSSSSTSGSSPYSTTTDSSTIKTTSVATDFSFISIFLGFLSYLIYFLLRKGRKP